MKEKFSQEKIKLHTEVTIQSGSAAQTKTKVYPLEKELNVENSEKVDVYL